MNDRSARYSEDRTFGARQRCDGKRTTWLADWRTEVEEHCCDECGNPEEPYEREWDQAELPYHIGPIKRLRGDMERCEACGEDWDDLVGALKRIYSTNVLVDAVNRESAYRKALR